MKYCSQNELAQEMGKSPTQVSRWFTTNDERRVVPELKTAELIEEAMGRLVARRKRREEG